ncbi:MAG: hypothetical protein U1A78_10175 [Polyangia bacterium]
MRRHTRVLGLSLFLSLGTGASGGPAAAQPGPAASEPTERTVVTKDGAMYRGEVLEYVVGSHITLRLDTGESKRIVWDDATQISPPRPKRSSPPPAAPSPPPAAPPSLPPPSSAPPSAPSGTTTPTTSYANTGIERTVLTKDSVTYHGEVVEYEVSDHVTLKLATGEVKRIGWAEAKRISPPRQKGDPSPLGSPERTLILRDGTSLRGDLVESVLGDHTTLRMPGGDIRRASWGDIKRILVPLPAGGRSPIPTTGELVVTLDTGARVVGEYFEYTPEQLILRHPSGRLHVIPVAAIRKVVVNGDTSSP